MAENKIYNGLRVFVAFVLLVKIFVPSFVIAQSVEDNNSGSQNSISQSTSSTTDINQQNSAQIGSSVSVSLNTGGNAVNSSTGGSNINTGDASFAAQIENEANSSSVETGCCATTTLTPKISDNNSDSENTINESYQYSTDVNINQNTNITSEFNVSVSTGGNKIANSTGSSSIVTGDAVIKAKVENGPINVADVVVYDPSFSASSVISGNNSDSINTISSSFSFQSKISIDHSANIKNIFNFILHTGKNEIVNNKGMASIFTGDVFLALLVKNGPINVSRIELNCCSCPGPEVPTPTITPTITVTPTPTPTTVSGSGGPTNPSSGGGGGGGGSSSVEERVAAMVLGATGSFMENLFYVFFSLGCIILGFGIRRGINFNFAQTRSSMIKNTWTKFENFKRHELEITLFV